MIVLGLSPLDKDSTVTIMRDGRVLFAAGEERFTRNKLQDGFPTLALQAALQHSGIKPDEIDVVAYPFFDWKKETELFTKNIRDEEEFMDDTAITKIKPQIEAALAHVPNRTQAIPGLAEPNTKMEKPLLHKMFYKLAGMEGV